MCIVFVVFIGGASVFVGMNFSVSNEESTILVAWIISCAIIIITFLICISAIAYRIMSKEKTKNELAEKNSTLKQIYESVFKDKKK